MWKVDSASLFSTTNRLDKTGEPSQMSHWKQDKRDMKIDFDYLNKAFSTTLKSKDDDSTSFTESQTNFCGSSYVKISDVRSSQSSESKPTPTLSLHSSTLNYVLRGSKFEDLVSTGQSFEKLFSEEWWLDFQYPSKEALQHVCRAFDIHPLTIEDIWNQETSEKIEQYPSYQFVCFRSFNEATEDDELIFKPFTIYQIIFSRGVLSFCFNRNNHSKNVDRRISMHPNSRAMKSKWTFYYFIDEIVDSFQLPISRVENTVSKIEDSVYMIRQKDGRSFLAEIEARRKQILTLIRFLSRKEGVLRGFKAHHLHHSATLTSTSTSTLTPNLSVFLYINDVQDHIITKLSTLHQLERLLFRAKSNFITHLHGRHYKRKTKIFKMMCSYAVFNMLLTVGLVVAQAFAMNVSTKARLFVDKDPVPFMVIVCGYVVLMWAFHWAVMKFVWIW